MRNTSAGGATVKERLTELSRTPRSKETTPRLGTPRPLWLGNMGRISDVQRRPPQRPRPLARLAAADARVLAAQEAARAAKNELRAAETKP
eukprot:6028070-Prymnesium_polylepis.2